MAGKKMEGNAEQRRAAARDAREQGKRPSEVGATLGASKQEGTTAKNASHQERLDMRHKGKAHRGSEERARPGNRDEDPKREGDWT